jgi:tRNA-splicing ligase RtcB (3'-phosphate/5'-hydroxy nucleic acid ligase)
MTPAKEIFKRITHDPRFEPTDFLIGYDSRFDGLRESTFEGFGLSEIPWHRVQYIRDSSGIQWDRRTKLDLIDGSGEPNAVAGAVAAASVRTMKKDLIMKPKELLALGIPQRALALTAQLLKSHPEKRGMLEELKSMLANPAEYTGHFLPLVNELTKPTPVLARDEPVPYQIWGTGLDAGSLEQMKNAARLPVAVRGALMPDAHQGYGLPIGGVLATEGAIIPYAVGVDIACRMKLSILDLPVSKAFSRHFEELKRAIETETKFGTGMTWQRPLEHEVLDADWSITRVTKDVFAKARGQLGTSGSGNHFVEFGIVTLEKPDLGLEAGQYLALLSHSGSRGAGAAVANHYSNLAMNLRSDLPKELKHLAWLEMTSEAGLEYWAAMNLMGEYASANHALIHKKIVKAIGANVLAGVENHHNFAWLETHMIDGVEKEVYVHRKGATPAGAGVLGVIPGSMATPGFVVRGLGNPSSLHSASHGAGRAMSRTKAKEQFNWKMVRPKLEAAGVTLLAAGIDENPFAYKDIEAVMNAQTDLVKVIARFDPRIVKMADDGTSED